MFLVVIPVHNAEAYVAKCIRSLREQEVSDWRAVVMEDASTDATAARLDEAIEGDPGFLVVRNAERQGGLANIMEAVRRHSPQDQDVIVTVDGDDWLAHPRVFIALRRIYADPAVRMTYGQAVQVSDGKLHPDGPYPENVIRARSYRRAAWRGVHLRTFKYGLWRRILHGDLLDPGTGRPWEMAWDLAFMLPMLEMCRPGQAAFGGEVLYVYNDVNPIGDNKKNVMYQMVLARLIRTMPNYDVVEEI